MPAEIAAVYHRAVLRTDRLVLRPWRDEERVTFVCPVPGCITMREVETGRVSDLLEQSRLVTLVGPGGAGKTSLAVAVAGRIADRYPDGLWWVPLGNIGAGSQLPTAVADAIGLSDPEARSVRSLLAAWLAPWRFRLRQEEHDAAKARTLVRAWGVDTLAPFALRADKSYFFDEREQAFIAYRVVAGVAIVSGGVRVLIEGLPTQGLPPGFGPLGVVDVSTDRAVIWAAGVNSDATGANVQSPDQPLEIYMEGNIEFRQGDRVVYADRMFYDARRQIGVILNAELLTPL